MHGVYRDYGKAFSAPALFLARCSRNELIWQIDFLKSESQMLRRRFPQKCVILTQHSAGKRWLVKLGQATGPGLAKLITIARYQPYLYWIRKLKNYVPQKRSGRPRTPEDIRALVIKIAKDTGPGYTRILGELRKLQKSKISRQTVVNIMKHEGSGSLLRGLSDRPLSESEQLHRLPQLVTGRLRLSRSKIALNVGLATNLRGVSLLYRTVAGA